MLVFKLTGDWPVVEGIRGDWDNSIGVNIPGQSGDPSSPPDRNLFELLARLEPGYFAGAG